MRSRRRSTGEVRFVEAPPAAPPKAAGDETASRAGVPEAPPAPASAVALREQIDDIVRLASDLIWETDTRLALTSISHRVFEVLGYHPRELIGRSLLTLTGGATPPTALMRCLAGLSPFRDLAIDTLAKGGEQRQLTLSGVPVFDRSTGALAGFRGTASDVTLLRQRENALRTAKDAAEAANRAKSEFLANTSHELRTPLNAIIGFAEILKMELLGPLGSEQYRSYVGDIHKSAEKLLHAINDILEMSRLETGGAQLSDSEVDVRDLVGRAMEAVHARAEGAGVRLGSVVAEALPPVRADTAKLHRILLNLLSNAIRFTPAGGAVTLTAGRAPNGDLVLVVADTGIGIHRNDLERVMEPFTQVDGRHTRKYDGAGLGLPLARGLARLHGGDLTLDSEPGVGTTASLRLPADRLLAR